MWTLRLQIRKVSGLDTLNGLYGHPSRSIEDSVAEGDMNCAGPSQEVSEEKNIVAW